MPSMLLVGLTNNGKTMIIEKFRRTHPPIDASKTSDGAAQVPVLTVEMLAVLDEARDSSAILDRLVFPHVLFDRQQGGRKRPCV